MDDIGAITFQINTSIKVIFPDKSTEVLHVHSDKTEILINNENEIKQDIGKHIDNIKYKFENQAFKKSGGSIKSIGKIRLMISQYKPLRGSSYFPLPDKIKKIPDLALILKMRMTNALNIVSSVLCMVFLINRILRTCITNKNRL